MSKRPTRLALLVGVGLAFVALQAQATTQIGACTAANVDCHYDGIQIDIFADRSANALVVELSPDRETATITDSDRIEAPACTRLSSVVNPTLEDDTLAAFARGSDVSWRRLRSLRAGRTGTALMAALFRSPVPVGRTQTTADGRKEHLDV